MAVLVLARDDLRRIIARRRRLGHDRYDEVWDGVYVMSPLADNTHQEIATLLAATLLQAGLPPESVVLAGTNVSDRVEGWKKNYRCPDVAVFLPGTRAVNHETFWHGGPDFAVEVRSKGDRSRKKLPFYATVGTRELLIVDRNPWALELYRLEEGQMRPAGRATAEGGEWVESHVVPLAMRLVAAEKRPAIEVRHRDGRGEWRI